MSRRIERVNQLIKEEISKIVLKEIELPKDILVTVTRVETSADLREARVYISCLPEENTSKVFKILNSNIHLLQKKINQRLSMKKIPRIKLFEEKETGEAARVEELLGEIKGKSLKKRRNN